MPKYQHAKPFDIVRTIGEMRKAISQLQIQNPGSATAWQSVSLVNGWTGTLNARITGSGELQLSGNRLIPGTLTGGTLIGTLTASMAPQGQHEVVITIDDLPSAVSGSPRLSIHTDGTLLVFGLGGTTSELSIEITIPLDV